MTQLTPNSCYVIVTPYSIDSNNVREAMAESSMFNNVDELLNFTSVLADN